MDETTNQEVVEDTVDTTLADNDGVTAEIEYDDEGNPIEAEIEAEEEEEVELDDDLKLKLPKSQAEKLRLAALRQADYTRKTQEVAEERKALAAERQALAQADEQEMSARANIAIIDRQIQQYENVDWNAAFENDPFEAQKAFARFQLLQRDKEQASTYLDQTRQQRTEAQKQETARLIQEGAAELARDIPEWSPDLSAKLQDFGAKQFGLTQADFNEVYDPRAVKLLHAAYQWHQHQAGQTKAKAIVKQQEVQPAASPAKKASAPPTGLDDRLSIDEWNRRREAQLRKKAG
jgi:hypothetical protein